MAPAQHTGRITVLNDRGYGFLVDDEGIEHFFHRSAVAGDFDALAVHQVVMFEPQDGGAKGPRCASVMP